MPFRDDSQHFRDILLCISNIEDFRAGMSFAQIQADRKTEAAVERELQILTEAAFRLSDQAAALCPDADWRNIRGLGNVLRHAYDNLSTRLLEDILDADLPALRTQVERALARLKETT